MNEIRIRHVLPSDLDDCFMVETFGFPPEEAATRETIKLRIDSYPEGFLVAEVNGKVVGILNSAATNKEDISNEELKQLIGHDALGKNIVVFALAVLPEFQKRGIASQLMSRLVKEARQGDKENVLLMCKEHLIAYYERMGFAHVGLSRSTHGGPNGTKCAWRCSDNHFALRLKRRWQPLGLDNEVTATFYSSTPTLLKAGRLRYGKPSQKHPRSC